MRRKIQAVSEFNFEMEHVSGASNTIADFLSRYPFKVTLRDSSTETAVTSPAESWAQRVNKVTQKSLPEQAQSPSDVEPPTWACIIIEQENVDRAHTHAEEAEIYNPPTSRTVDNPARELTNEPVHQRTKIPASERLLERCHNPSEPVKAQTIDRATGPDDIEAQGTISEGIDIAEPLPSGTGPTDQQIGVASSVVPPVKEQGYISPAHFSDQSTKNIFHQCFAGG